MSRIVVLNTTGLNVGQLSHLNINSNPDRGEMGIYANLINGQKLFLQSTESFDDAISLLKKFSQIATVLIAHQRRCQTDDRRCPCRPNTNTPPN